MNDSQELRHGMGVLAQVCHDEHKDLFGSNLMWNTTERYSETNVFVCSFCESGDLLSQWRGYSNGGGVSIGFSVEKLDAAAGRQGFQLVRCEYHDFKQKWMTQLFVRHFLKTSDPNKTPEEKANALASSFITTAARFKHSSFREENEWRLIGQRLLGQGVIKARTISNGLLPYTSFDLKADIFPKRHLSPYGANDEDIGVSQVVIGPHPHQALQGTAMWILSEQHEVHVPQTTASQIPFRQF